jgi:hypothetical protein
MTIKELNEALQTATIETAKAWLADSEKTIFFIDFASLAGRVSAWDDNFERLRDIFETKMENLLNI